MKMRRGSLASAPLPERVWPRVPGAAHISLPGSAARALRTPQQGAMPPASWLAKQSVAKQAEHCARATPECFEDDPGVIRVFLNGKRTVFGGVEKLRPEVLTWGDNVKQPVNECVDAIPPRLTDDDIGITQEQWAGFIADLNKTFERLPLDPAVTTLTAGLVDDSDWKAVVREVCEAHTKTTFLRGVGALSLEEAFWTEVVPQPNAPKEDENNGFRDPVSAPRAMPAVIIRLHFPSRAAFLRYVEDRAAADTAPPGSAEAREAQARLDAHSKRVHVDRRVSLLPWEKRWQLVPPQRMFGHRASYHVGV